MASLVPRALLSLTKKVRLPALTIDTVRFSSISVEKQPLRTISGLFRNSNLLLPRPAFISSTKCQFQTLHTEGDRRFVDVLQNEIAEEKERVNELPKFSENWNVSLKGSECSLTKVKEGDKIEINFNLNGAVPPLNEEEDGIDEEADIVAYPDFNVQISKPTTSKVVDFECFFPDDVQQGMDSGADNIFSIRSVCIHKGEVNEESYVIDTEGLQPEMYSFFLTFLADRSVDTEFARELIHFASIAEHREYISSLQDLKSFVSGK